MAYETPSTGVSKYLLNEGEVVAGQVFVDHAPDISEVKTNPDYITCIRMVSGNSNPKWMRDEVNIVIQVIGATKNKLSDVRDHAYSVYNKLLGAYNINLNGYIYYRFISNSGMPVLATYLDGEKPLYTMSFSFVREATTAEGNRELMS